MTSLVARGVPESQVGPGRRHLMGSRLHNIRLAGPNQTTVGQAQAPEPRLPPGMESLVVLGAGASHGYDDLPESDLPPTTDGLMTCGEGQRLLRQSRYADLRILWHLYSDAEPEGKVPDFELFAQEIASKLTAPVSRGPGGGSESELDWRDIQAAGLGSLWFFLFELFQPYCRDYLRRAREGRLDNYRRLVRSFADRPFALITLNYDPLLEAAAVVEGRPYSYSLEETPGTLPILKVHGSVTWLNPNTNSAGQAALGIGAAGAVLFREVCALANNISMNMADVREVTPEEYCTLDVHDLVRTEPSWSIPGLLPPIGFHKDYAQLSRYTKVWNSAEIALSAAPSVEFVGTSVRAQDVRLCSALATHLDARRVTTVVGGHGQTEARLESVLGARLSPACAHRDTFSDWLRDSGR